MKNNLIVRRAFNAICWFLGPLVIAMAAIQLVVEWRLDSAKKGEIGKINRILTGELDPPLSLWGASTTHIQLDPAIIGEKTGLPGYNLGLTGNAFWQYRGLLEVYLKESEKASLVVIAMNVLEFEKRDKIYLVHQWLHQLDTVPVYSALQSIDSSVWKYKYVPFYRPTVYDRHVFDLLRADIAEARQGARAHEDAGPDLLGFVPDPTPWRLGDAVVNKKHSIKVERQVTHELVRIASIGRNRGIRVEVVLLPCFAPYQQSIKNLEKLRVELDFLNANGVKTIDLLSDSICEDQKYWRDRHHLNASGAAVLSAILGDRLVEGLR